MALIFLGISKCPVCDQTLQKGEELFGTSGGSFDFDDPLFRFYDAGMHLACFHNWNRREEFISTFNQWNRSNPQPDGTFRIMEKDGSISWFEDSHKPAN